MTPRDAEMVDAYRGGDTLRGLAARFGVSMQRCHHIVTEHGAIRPARANGLVWTDEMDARLRGLRARGVGIDPLAWRLGVTPAQVAARLRALGLPMGRGWRRHTSF